MKVIYLSPVVFSKRDYDRFGIDIMQKKGHECEIWDLSYCVYGERSKPQRSHYSGKNLVIINSKACFDKYILKEKSATFVDLSAFGRDELFIKKTLAENKHKYIWIFVNSIPTLGGRKRESSFKRNISIVKKFFGKLCSVLLRDPKKDNQFEKTIQSIRNNMPYKVFLGASRDFYNLPREIRHDLPTVYIHTLDYDLFLTNLMMKQKTKEGSYIVFIDAGYVDHPDYILTGTKSAIYGKEQKFFTELQQVFTALEEHYHIPVVIAAHPRVIYRTNVYGDRKIVYSKTIDLVRNAELVLMNWSTASNFAVLYNKPILMLYNEQIKASVEWKEFYIPCYKALGLKPFMMEKLSLTNKKNKPWIILKRLMKENINLICKTILRRITHRNYYFGKW